MSGVAVLNNSLQPFIFSDFFWTILIRTPNKIHLYDFWTFNFKDQELIAIGINDN